MMRIMQTTVVLATLISMAWFGPPLHAGNGITTLDVAKLRYVTSVEVSPSGQHIAYLLSVPRTPFVDDNGSAWTELHVVDMQGQSRPYITGEVNISSIKWVPDGSAISYLAKRFDDEHKSLYKIPALGGESQKVFEHDTDIRSYSWHADGVQFAFTATEVATKEEKSLKDKGFNQEVYEEDLQLGRVWLTQITTDEFGRIQADADARELKIDGHATSVEWSPVGHHLAVAVAPTPLIDDHLMKRKVHVVDASDGKDAMVINNPGKIGSYKWSPDGQYLAMDLGKHVNDPSNGRLMVASIRDGQLHDLMPNYKGDVMSFAWQDANTLMYLADEGVTTTLAKISRDGSSKKTIVPIGTHSLNRLGLSADGQVSAMTSDTPGHPTEVFTMKHGDEQPRRLTNSNPWLNGREFAKQEIITYKAKDGLELHGLLIRPLNEQPGKKYPLVLIVHGGPEAHFKNGWLTAYSRPGQVLASRGFAVFYPNYRGSTGRGVEFSMMGQSDYGGKEFDDLIDAVDHLIAMGLVDKDRVGVTGGSYGGFASAWCATYHTNRFAASVMFVGISDQISKFGTTDIPNEMFLVHARKWPWDDWEFFRERSPITYAEQCRTPILIMHGKEDTRVHPSQSMELYRYLKTLGNVPVRLVFYPGEGHGNRKAAARIDYSMRLVRWMEHYLMGSGGTAPPFELDYSSIKPQENADNEDS